MSGGDTLEPELRAEPPWAASARHMLGGAAVNLTMAMVLRLTNLEGFFDRVLEELLRLDAVEDSTISASLAKKTATIMVTIDAPSPEGPRPPA
jgi:hypothetical protein